MDGNLAEQYAVQRGANALDNSTLLPLEPSLGNVHQPASQFGLHPQLTSLQSLYNDGDALFVANAGMLIEPLTKQDFATKSKALPDQLFAHNTQTRYTQTANPTSLTRTDGVLGRMINALHADGYSTASYSIGANVAVAINPTEGSPAIDVVGSGTAYTASVTALHHYITQLTEVVSGSPFKETWSSVVSRSLDLNRTRMLADLLSNTALETEFSENNDYTLPRQLKQVAKLIKAGVQGDLADERAVFYVELPGFDVHTNSIPAMNSLMKQIDSALQLFTDEMKAQQVWDQVTIVQASEFGRTITSNGHGVDHAWGGNYFVAGGDVKGRQLLGRFPNDLTPAGPLNVGRGRLIPTTSWDHIFNAVGAWFDVGNAAMDAVLPTRGNFDDLFEESDMFLAE